jgi:hypothetical protein
MFPGSVGPGERSEKWSGALLSKPGRAFAERRRKRRVDLRFGRGHIRLERKAVRYGMTVERLQRNGFAVERHGVTTATYFVYAGPMRRVELMPSHKMLHVPYTRLDDTEHVDDLVEALWELSLPGVVDSIEVAYKEGDPNETMTVRERSPALGIR